MNPIAKTLKKQWRVDIMAIEQKGIKVEGHSVYSNLVEA